ncbi:MAG TPA: RNA polymerase sigma factor [Polyangiaceae bacterium]|nr:RNA polymerase sigma factor [Polyangiaceae bacterium]
MGRFRVIRGSDRAPLADAGDVSTWGEGPFVATDDVGDPPRGRWGVAELGAAAGELLRKVGLGARSGRRGGAGPDARAERAERAGRSERARGRAAELAPHTPGDTPALALIAKGERHAAIGLLMRAHGESVYDFCLQIVRDETLAEDTRQKVFIQAYEGMSKFAGGSSLRTWLLGIAKYRSLDALRARRRESARVVSDDELLAEAAGGGLDPREQDCLDRARGALSDCLESCVSADERRLIELHFRDGLSYEELSALFGEKADTLRARVARALPKLRRGLAGRGVEI